MKDVYEYYPLMDIYDIFMSSNRSDVELSGEAIINKPIMLLEKENLTWDYIVSYYVLIVLKLNMR